MHSNETPSPYWHCVSVRNLLVLHAPVTYLRRFSKYHRCLYIEVLLRISRIERPRSLRSEAVCLTSCIISSTTLLAFCCLVGLRAEIRCSCAAGGEESGEDWLDERAEDDLGTAGHWQRHPENQDKLEDVVEWEPVDGIDHALNYIEEGVDNPVGQPLGVVDLASAEECIEGVVSRKDEPSKVHKKLAANVEEDEEEVEADKAEEGVDLGDASLLLEIVEGRILG